MLAVRECTNVVSAPNSCVTSTGYRKTMLMRANTIRQQWMVRFLRIIARDSRRLILVEERYPARIGFAQFGSFADAICCGVLRPRRVCRALQKADRDRVPILVSLQRARGCRRAWSRQPEAHAPSL